MLQDTYEQDQVHRNYFCLYAPPLQPRLYTEYELKSEYIQQTTVEKTAKQFESKRQTKH